MKVAFIGDVVGRAGRRTVARLIPEFKQKHSVDLTIANLENSAGGFGVTEKAFRELEKAGVDFFTSGNHIWDKREGVDLLDLKENIVRPANYPSPAPGHGYQVFDVNGTGVAVFNIQGRVFMPPIDCPFRGIDRCIEHAGNDVTVRIVDMHAEATSEKIAMGWYLDGRVSVLVGTHTHVATRDARVLPQGTGYVTDAGMTGANDSVLGVDKDVIVKRFLEQRPARFDVARRDLRCDVVLMSIDDGSGKTTEIEHFQLRVED